MISYALIKIVNTILYGKAIECWNNLPEVDRKQLVEFRALFIYEYGRMLREWQGPPIYRLIWDLDFFGRGLEGLLLVSKVVRMWVLYRQIELVQLNFHINHFGLHAGFSLRILNYILQN